MEYPEERDWITLGWVVGIGLEYLGDGDWSTLGGVVGVLWDGWSTLGGWSEYSGRGVGDLRKGSD